MENKQEGIDRKNKTKFICDRCKQSNSKIPYCQYKGCKFEAEEQMI